MKRFLIVLCLSACIIIPGSICHAQKYGYNVSTGLSKILFENSKDWNPGAIVTLNGFYHKNSIMTLGFGVSYSYLSASQAGRNLHVLSPMPYEVSQPSSSMLYGGGHHYKISKDFYSIFEITSFIRSMLFENIAGDSDIFLQLGLSYIHEKRKVNLSEFIYDNLISKNSSTNKYLSPGFVIGLGIIHGRRSGFNYEIMPQFKYILSSRDDTQIFTLIFGLSL